MSGKFVIKWVQSENPHPFLKVVRCFSIEKKKTVPFVEWEPTAATATQYGSAAAALSEWERLGYAKPEYVTVVEMEKTQSAP